jgi:hypothetical protein
LNLANISGTALAGGNTFKIFNAATYGGSFSGITPATPGSGLTWNTSQLSSGVISVSGGSSGVVISSTKVSGGNLIFSGSGGTANGSYNVLTTTNLLSVWVPIATNNFDSGGNFSVTNAIVPGVPQEFYLIKY